MAPKELQYSTVFFKHKHNNFPLSFTQGLNLVMEFFEHSFCGG